MEIELKYAIPDEATERVLWNNELFADVEEEGSREELHLNAKYFDTEDGDLANNEIAYRVREEGERYVAAMKWKGRSEDGLHVREEINVHVDDDTPNPEVFRESSVGEDVLDLLQGKELKCVLESRILRKKFRIDTGKGIFEISIDSGEVITEAGTAPINEIEIELFSGETEELMEVGRRIQERYNLKPENISKYARGMELIKRHK
ncbi:MAG: CYTH domain-containing protein [Firmicutes bacterium]|nr:CYTH domain-containing protein [Bacillota bacterium]